MIQEFINSSCKNHLVYYQDKIVEIDYCDFKNQFQIACFKVRDNSSIGFVKTPKGEYFMVSRQFRSAKKFSEQKILEFFGVEND